ncbi:MAG: hypothetical protein H0X71_03630, partial [Rubrobacter sp.]|nr:hypothetical protein [Rubrobacter sp.]
THFTLAAGGHIAGMMAPPDKAKGYWTSEETGSYETPDEWLENAEQHEGTWWEDFISWLKPHSGEQVDPPQLGSENYPPIEDAPGTYVKEMHEDEEEGKGAQVTQEATQGDPREKWITEFDRKSRLTD